MKMELFVDNFAGGGGPLSGRNRKYCSPECRKKENLRLQNLKNKEIYKSSKPKAEPKDVVKKKRGRPKKWSKTLAEINERARLEGLSYGQYIGKYGL